MLLGIWSNGMSWNVIVVRIGCCVRLMCSRTAAWLQCIQDSACTVVQRLLSRCRVSIPYPPTLVDFDHVVLTAFAYDVYDRLARSERQRDARDHPQVYTSVRCERKLYSLIADDTVENRCIIIDGRGLYENSSEGARDGRFGLRRFRYPLSFNSTLLLHVLYMVCC